MRQPGVRLTVRQLMVAAAVVAGCLSFAARAERLRGLANARVSQHRARVARGGPGASAEDWRGYQRAQDDLLKADFLESFGIVTAILVPVAGVGFLAWKGRRREPSEGRAHG